MSRAFKVVLLRPDKYPVLSIPGTKFHAFKDRAFKVVPRAGLLLRNSKIMLLRIPTAYG